MVAVEVTDCDVTQERGGHVDGLPGGETTPRDVDFGPVQRDNICAAVAVEVAEAKLASVLGHAIQEAPLRLAAGGKVPARARADEHVIDAVAVEVTDGEICSWIGGLECVGPNHMLRGIRCGGDEGGALLLEKKYVVKSGGAAKRLPILDNFM